MGKQNSSSGRGLNLKAKLDVAEAIKNAQALKREIGAIAGVTTGTSKGFDVKPLTEYQAGILKIKQEALDLAKQKQEQALADKAASLALQAALREERSIKQAANAADKAEKQALNTLAKEQAALQKQVTAEANRKNKDRSFDKSAELDSLKKVIVSYNTLQVTQDRSLKSDNLQINSMNAKYVAYSRLATEMAKQAAAEGNLTSLIIGNTGATKNSTAAGNDNKLSKQQLAAQAKELAIQLAAEKLRLAENTKELKNSAREQLNAKGSLEQRRAALIRLTAVYDKLNKAERESAAGSRLSSIIKDLVNQIKALEEATGRSQRSVGGYADGIGAFFNSIKSNISSTLGLIGILTAAWAAAKAAFEHNVEISDNFTDVQRTAKLSKEEVREFGKELKGLDTRTSLEGLLDIGFIGGRLAVPKKDLKDFVQQVDELAVVLKKEFPGGAEAVAESLGKIVTIYKVTEKEGVSLGTALSKVGSNFLELAHSGPVTVKYLQDFTLGVAGTAVSAKLSIPVISAYGAVLGESGQIASSSALAVTRLVNGLTTKPAKYAAIAQLADSSLTVEKFTKIINTDTKQALDLFFKGLNHGNPVQTEFAQRLDSIGIKTGKVSNAVKILAENQDKLAVKLKVGGEGFEENTSVAHNFELANDNLAASVDKLHNTLENLTTDPNSSLAGFFKGIIDGSTYALKAIDDLGNAISKQQHEKDLDLIKRSKPTLLSSIFGSGDPIDPKELAAARARVKAVISQSLNDDIAGKGYATANILAANKDELQIRKLLTGEINKQKIAVDRLGNALAFVSDPKNTEAQTAVVEKSINRLRAAARQQSAVVAGLKAKLPKEVNIYGDGSLVDTTDDGRTIADIKAKIKALVDANSKLDTESKQFIANRAKLIALRKELRIANGGKDTEGIKAANEYESALKSRNDLQAKISELTKKGTDKQLSADQQELESVKDKYAKMRAEVVKFNNDPVNKKKGLRVDGSGLSNAEANESNAVTNKQETAKLKVTLEEQKKLYDGFEDYKKKVGVTKAKERYADLIDTDKTYLENLEQQQRDIQFPQKSKGGEEVDAEANQLKLKLLAERIAAEKILQQQKDDDIYAEAYSSAMTNAEKILAIDQDYQKKRTALGKNATAEQLKNLQKEKEDRVKAQNNANAEQLSGYADLMENIDAMSRGRILKEIAREKAIYAKQYADKLITAREYTDKINQLNSVEDSLNGDNIFNNISNAIKRYKEAKKAFEKSGSKDDAKGILDKRAELFRSIGEGAEAASVGMSGLADIFDQLGVGGEKLQVVLKDVAGVLSGAGEIAKGIATNNPVAIVSGSIKLLSSAIDLFNGKDRKLNRKIEAYKLQLDSLGKAYKQLERDVINSVGESYYSDSAKQIENLKAQQEELIKMRDAERSKKKADQGKITEYQNQIDDIPNQIADINKAISQNLIQTNFKDLSNSLADALSDAFAAGESAAEKFDDVFDQVIVNAVKNSLKLKILDPIVKKFTDDLTAYAQGNDNSVIGFDFEKYRALLKAGGNLVTAGLDQIKNYFPDATSTADSATGISGKIVGEAITEGTANRMLGITIAQHDTIKQLLKVQTNYYDVAVRNMNVSLEIAANTLRTANNTEGISAKLDQVITNTKPVTETSIEQKLRDAGQKSA